MNYRALALADLASVNMTAESMIESHTRQLTRFLLSCDMGELNINLPPALPGEDALLPAAKAWL